MTGNQSGRQLDRTNWVAVKRVAWIRSGAIGDLLVGLASLVEVHSYFPNARVTVVGPQQLVEILNPLRFPFIERIAVIERKRMQVRILVPNGGSWVLASPVNSKMRSDMNSEMRSETRSETTRIENLSEQMSKSESEKISIVSLLKSCDAVVNTNIDSLRYGFAAFQAGVPIRVGSAPPLMTWLYSHSAPFFGKDPLIHERDAALLILENASSAVGRHFNSVRQARERLPEYINESNLIKKWQVLGLPIANPQDFSKVREIVGAESKKYVLFNPTASRREKAWPAERVRKLLLTLTADLKLLGLSPCVIGSPAETPWLHEVAGAEFKIIQPKNLSDLQDVVAGARLLITNASSMQYFAAMTKTPVLTIMGRANPMVWGPLGKGSRYIKSDPNKLSHEFDKLSTDQFQEEQRLFRSIEVEDVATQVRSMLKIQEVMDG